MPKSAKGWAYFIAATVIALAVVNSVARRVPALGQLTQGF